MLQAPRMARASRASFKVTRRRAARWSPAEARTVLAEMSASGLSTREFASRKGLDPQRLWAWARKLGEATTEREPPAFIEVVQRVSAPLEEVQRGGAPVEVVLRSGIVLRVDEGVNAIALRRIVDALESPPQC
jgi:hypothetical protein